MQEAWVPTRLKHDMFPTATEMNTGQGPIMAAREARWIANAERNPPMQGAYVMKQFMKHFKYADSDDFLKSPKELEEKFAKVVGSDVPQDYLGIIEACFERIHSYFGHILQGPPIDAVPQSPHFKHTINYGKLTCYTPVLYAVVAPTLMDNGKLCITLYKVAVRQCGETFGFCRLLLNELARNCVHFGVPLKIDTALKATEEILKRSFPHSHSTEELDYWIRPADLTNAAYALGVVQYLLQQPKAAVADKKRKKKKPVASASEVVARTPPDLWGAFQVEDPHDYDFAEGFAGAIHNHQEEQRIVEAAPHGFAIEHGPDLLQL